MTVIFFKDFIYLFIETQRERERERERGRDTGRGRSKLHAESPSGTHSRVSRITPWAVGGAKPLRPRGCP